MSDTVEIERNPLTKKELVADKPTWCPGCGDGAMGSCPIFEPSAVRFQQREDVRP